MDRSIYQFLGADTMEKEHVKSLRQWFVWMIIIFILPILLVLAYFLFITPKEAVIVNEVGEPLTVGACWEQNELFLLTVTDVNKIDWDSAGLDQYLAEKNAKDVYQAQREAGYGIYDIGFTCTNHSYPGYTDRFERGKPYKEGLQFGIRIEGELNHKKEIQRITQWPLPIVPIKPGQTAEDNHIIVLAGPEIEEFTVSFTVRQEDRAEKLADTDPDHVYQKLYRCQLPE